MSPYINCSSYYKNLDPPTEVNEFGMGIVHLWNQRKSLEIINGVIHRNYGTAEGLTLYKQILVPAPLRANSCTGSMGIQPHVILGYRKLPINCNVTLTGPAGGRTQNSLYDAAITVVGTARGKPDLRDL